MATKYKVGDILLTGNYTAEYYRITSVTSTQYVLQAYYESGEPNGTPFALGIAFVDANPDWHKKSEMSKYVWYGLGALAIVGVIAMANSPRRG